MELKLKKKRKYKGVEKFVIKNKRDSGKSKNSTGKSIEGNKEIYKQKKRRSQ